MQKKVKGWIAILAIIALTVITAWAISTRAAAAAGKQSSGYALFFGGTIKAVTVCGPTGCPPCRPDQTMVVLNKETSGTGFPLFCYSPGSSVFIGPPPAPGVSVLGFGPQINPILFYTSR